MLNAVIDISHHNSKSLNFKLAKADGILGVIRKASQGTTGRDPIFRTNRKKVHDAGLMWGAYHFANGSDGMQQAVNFLDAVGDPRDVLMVLDLEPNPTRPSMNLIEAHAFVTHAHEQTGRWPGLYSGHTIKELLGSSMDPLLANCWLWLAQYGPTAVVPPNWPTRTTWQYTDGAIAAIPSRSTASAIATAIVSTVPRRVCASSGTAADPSGRGALRAARRMLARAPNDLHLDPPAPAR
ncbi:MAG TPA: glycoside hydrolase family 25 protein [Croceibacterium sp.]|nr:glycoside hydrolase family 25 protein [Croceibacterium sp.]